jgi:putative transposase
MEHIWEFLRERYLSHRLHADHGTILYALSEAWLKLTPWRLRSLTNYP